MERRMWRVAEVAEALALSRAKVALMVQRGELPAQRFGRAVRIDSDVLAEFLRRRAGRDGEPERPEVRDAVK